MYENVYVLAANTSSKYIVLIVLLFRIRFHSRESIGRDFKGTSTKDFYDYFFKTKYLYIGFCMISGGRKHARIKIKKIYSREDAIDEVLRFYNVSLII